MEISRTTIVKLVESVFRTTLEYIVPDAIVVDVYGKQQPFDTWLQGVREDCFELGEEFGITFKEDAQVRFMLQFLNAVIHASPELLEIDLEPMGDTIEDFITFCDEHTPVPSDTMLHLVESVKVTFFHTLKRQIVIATTYEEKEMGDG